MNQKIFNEIVNILKVKNNYLVLEKPEEISATTELDTDLSLDSIQILDLIVDIEDKFEITIDFSELSFEDIKNMESLISLIEKQPGVEKNPNE